MTRQQTTRQLNQVLEAIGSRGLSGVASKANSLLKVLENVDAFPSGTTMQNKRSICANLRRLGLIEVTKTGDDLLVQPSVKGIHRLQRAKIAALTIQHQSRWDGTWRMVSYDIPARYGKERRLFTSELHRLGFTLLKDSMWFHPYPCFDVLSELIAYCGLTQFVMVAEIARLDEGSLRRLYKAHPTLNAK